MVNNAHKCTVSATQAAGGERRKKGTAGTDGLQLQGSRKNVTAGADRNGGQLARKASESGKEGGAKQGSGSLFWEIEVENKQS